MDDLIFRLALENAVKYNGKANLNAILGKIFSLKKVDDKNEVINKVKKIIKKVNSMKYEKQLDELKEMGGPTIREREEQGLIDLPNVKGKVIMRLAPYPSGPLHIGNTRVFILNDEYAKKYKGKLLLFMDDTIGSEEKDVTKEAYKLIEDGLRWLDVKFDKKIYYKSDRLEIYYKYAEQLIRKNKAYVCSCSAVKLRENRIKGVECKCRGNDIKKNLELWKKIFKAKEGSLALRLKTDMKHKDPAFRDRVLFRISDRKHPRIGKKYRVWPLLDFSWAIDDHLLKITHILRGKDLMMESMMEKYIWNIFKWKHPEIIHSGLLQIEGIKLSKSKAKKEVISGEYSGWDDPRTWSLQSLKRRGIRPEAIRNFILGLGLTQTEIKISVESLYAENRKIIEKLANRYFFVENPKKINIKYAPEVITKIDLHPDFKDRGYKVIRTKGKFYVQDKLEKDKTYRFMNLFNFKNKTFVSQEYNPKMDAKLIHWVGVDDCVNVSVLMDDGKVVNGVGEKALRSLKIGDLVQFNRLYFARLDKKEKDRLVFWYSHK